MPRIATPGDLRERVEFQRRNLANDGYGNTVTNNWAELYSCAARIMPLRSGEERVDARRLTGFQTVAITVRMSSALLDLIPDDRVVDVRSGVIYDIQSIANFDEHRQYLEIGAVKRDVTPPPPPPALTHSGAGSSVGASTASAVGYSIGFVIATGSAAGTATALAAGKATVASAGNAAGASAVLAISGAGAIISGAGSSAGTSTASAIGTAISGSASAAGSAAGVSTALAVATAIRNAGGNAAGTATASGTAPSGAADGTLDFADLNKSGLVALISDEG